MTSDYVEERNGAYYVKGTRISLDSVVYSFKRGNSPEGIREEYELLDLPQIYGAIAFYLDHQTEIDHYLAERERTLEAGAVPLSEANPALWDKLQKAKTKMGESRT